MIGCGQCLLYTEKALGVARSQSQCVEETSTDVNDTERSPLLNKREVRYEVSS